MRVLTALFAFLLVIAQAHAAPTFPPLRGRVMDNANIISDATEFDLSNKLAALEQKTSRQLVVVTLPSLQGYEISDYGYQLGRAWGIGQAKLNNGVIFLIAPNEHKARIEVGYGLEPILTDALSEVILQTQVLPKFRAGDFDGGVEAGVEALIQQLSLNPSEAEARAAAAERQVQDRAGDQNGGGGIAGLVIFLFILFAIFRVFGGWGFLPFLFMGGGRRYGGYYGGGGWSGGGGFGGGGFSGGGGSFGGGGASGSW
jgi:uncharacterized protein